MQNRIKLALANDELLFRKGLMSLLNREKNLDTLFNAEDVHHLITKLKSINTL